MLVLRNVVEMAKQFGFDFGSLAVIVEWEVVVLAHRFLRIEVEPNGEGSCSLPFRLVVIVHFYHLLC
jgi:hypothetical protein